MEYLTGKHALNIKGGLQTCGDWHAPALKWDELDIRNSKLSLLKEYGIEEQELPNGKRMQVANHIRAVLDVLEKGKGLRELQGFRRDYFGVDIYNKEFFSKVILFNKLDHWESIKTVVGREFGYEWLNYEAENRNKIQEGIGRLQKLDYLNYTKGIRDLWYVVKDYRIHKEDYTRREFETLNNILYYTGKDFWEYELEVQYGFGINKKELKKELWEIYKDFGV